jgi:hypothetical protein
MPPLYRCGLAGERRRRAFQEQQRCFAFTPVFAARPLHYL